MTVGKAKEMLRALSVIPVIDRKTSLLERMFPEFRYISLDVGSNAETAKTRPEEFLTRHPPPLVLDEIVYAPSFFRFIKTYVDVNKGKNGLFILTGSQNLQLMESVSDSLAGRAAGSDLLGGFFGSFSGSRKNPHRERRPSAEYARKKFVLLLHLRSIAISFYLDSAVLKKPLLNNISVDC